jgi:hypothetical protein
MNNIITEIRNRRVQEELVTERNHAVLSMVSLWWYLYDMITESHRAHRKLVNFITFKYKKKKN